MSHLCIMASANDVHIRSIPSAELSLYARAYAEFNLSRRNTPRHPGLLSRYTHCPECGKSVGGDLVATELLRLVGEHEQANDPRGAVQGAIEEWFVFKEQRGDQEVQTS